MIEREEDPSRPLGDVGPYRILESLGQGGVGAVYLAEQSAPVHRLVALKLIKLGMETREVLARFELERRALAKMNHPGIARIYDAGEAEHGRPYFVMEYVEGLPITDYCDRNQLDLDARLTLFVQTCRAVQHAHQRGVIHRDIKPSNVLVAERDGEPVPVVIDFGLAKAICDDDAENSLLTQHGQLLGTPQYMSPEQIELSPDQVDTRTDVYSLGVLLYELILGSPPFQRSAADGIPSFVRRVCEEESPRPSTELGRLSARAGDIARNRRTDVASLARRVRGDLDRVTARALEKDREERYATASELAADVERFLCGEPVDAGPPTAVHRLRQFVARHRVAVAFLAVLVFAVVVGSFASTFWYLRADAERSDLAAVLRACGTVQHRVADAHLWFEEALAGDESIRLQEDVYDSLHRSNELVAGALEGGDTELGRLEPVRSARIAVLLRELRERLREFEDITDRRWSLRESSGRTGGDLDQEYDAVYRSILQLSLDVLEGVEALMAEKWRRSARLSIAVNFLAVAALAVPAVLVLRARGRRRRRKSSRVTG